MQVRNEAQVARDNSIEQVKDNNDKFYQEALAFSENWVKSRFKPFTAEDLKLEFQITEGKIAEQPSVWGAVIRKLMKSNMIIEHSTTCAKNKVSHSRLIRVWISKVYSEQQAKNRAKKPVVEQVEMKLF